MRLLAAAAALTASQAFAGSLEIDSFFLNADGDIQVYLTVDPGQPSQFVIATCFLLVDGKPVDDTNDAASNVSGPVRLSMTFYDPPQSGDHKVECRAEFY